MNSSLQAENGVGCNVQKIFKALPTSSIKQIFFYIFCLSYFFVFRFVISKITPLFDEIYLSTYVLRIDNGAVENVFNMRAELITF